MIIEPDLKPIDIKVVRMYDQAGEEHRRIEFLYLEDDIELRAHYKYPLEKEREIVKVLKLISGIDVKVPEPPKPKKEEKQVEKLTPTTSGRKITKRTKKPRKDIYG